MKTLLIAGLTLAISNMALAGLETRVLHIDAPETITEGYEVLTSDRNVLTVDPGNTELIEKLYEAEELNSLVTLDHSNNNVKELTVIEEGNQVTNDDPELHPMLNYTPSIVNTLELAEEMFKNLNGKTKWFSQCFNRAHIWSKEMFDNYQVKSMKILIYYTKKYRRTIDKKWWFHIAPMIDVNGERYVMDKEFTRKPTTRANWESIFRKKMEKKGIYGYKCKVIKNIKEFYNEENQKNEYCNIQITSMYYWEPNDMSRLDKEGTQKTEFINSELRRASKEAFKKWRKVYKKIKVQ